MRTIALFNAVPLAHRHTVRIIFCAPEHHAAFVHMSSPLHHKVLPFEKPFNILMTIGAGLYSFSHRITAVCYRHQEKSTTSFNTSRQRRKYRWPCKLTDA